MAEYEANELMLACAEDDLEKAFGLVTSGKPSVTATDSRGRTALHYCADNPTTEIAELLIQKKKNLVKVKDKYDVLPLHLAVISGNEAFIDLLLKFKADIDATDKDGHTVIHLAVANGHVDLIDFLLERGAKLNRPDKQNAFALHYAVQLCATAGQEAEAAPEKNGKGKKGKSKEVKIKSSGNKGIEVLEKLLSKDVDEDCRDVDQRTPLIWAASSGLKRVCEILLADGAALDISDKDGMTVLHAAVSRDQVDMIHFLVKQGCNVNQPDKSGCTPVFYAVSLGLFDCAQVLFRYDANPNYKDHKGRTPAHWAASKGSTQMLTLILHSNGNLWAENDKGDTPAHEAALCKENATVQFLLQQADDTDAVNKVNKDNVTCLHIAAITNNVELVKILLSCGAKKDILMNHMGKKISAEQAASLKKLTEVVVVLETMATGAPLPVKKATGGGGGEKKKEKKEKKEKKGGKKKK